MGKKIHQGKNVTRFRLLRGMKQDMLASILGEDWNQIRISRLEAKEEIEEDILEVVSKALNIPVEAIKNFDEETAMSIVTNTFNAEAVAYVGNYNCTFNPLEKWVKSAA